MIHVLEMREGHAHVYQTQNGRILRRGCTLKVPCSCTVPLQDVEARFVPPTASSWSAVTNATEFNSPHAAPLWAQDVLNALQRTEAMA